jgi:restriction system protein
VCSDETVAYNDRYDALLSHTSDLGVPVITDPEEIGTFLRQRSGPRVVFATYQSSPKIAEVFRLDRVPAFDLVIADELPAAGIALAIVVGLAVVIVVLERPWRYAVAMYRDRRRGEATLIQARADMIRDEIFLDELGRTPEEHARAVAETARIMEGVAAERIRREEQRIRLQEQAKEQRRRRDQQLAESAAIDLMTGTEFENYVAARLRLAGWTVSMTAATDDFDVDVIAERNGERVAVQCKRLGKVVGVGAVQQVVAGAMHHKCTRSLVVSNPEFTRAAMQLARTHSYQLVGRAQLRTWTLE